MSAVGGSQLESRRGRGRYDHGGLATKRAAQSEHIVQFYEEDEFLLNEVILFLGEALCGGGASVVIASPRHRAALKKGLEGSGFDVAAAREAGRYISLDAAETVARFLIGNRPNEQRFSEVIGDVLATAGKNGGSEPVRVFGEMVALLWADGNSEATIRLEELWNDMGQVYPFALFCAYPMHGFGSEVHTKPFLKICAQHSRVLPVESYSKLTDADEQLREIAELQQKASSLEEEIARRRKAEGELQRRMEELAEADRRKDEFLAMLGHELRNPLSPIVTALELARRAGTGRGVRDPLEVIARQTRRLTRLVDDLLDISRIARGRFKLQEEMILLTSIVDRAVEQARGLLEERRHRFQLDLPAHPIWLRADATRLEQVLANLLLNAAKYTDPGGEISVSAREREKDLVLRIRDNGMGLTPELKERMFELFVQSPESAARALGGLGIGLTLVRQIVQLHGGTVEASSDGPGRGCEMVVHLPGRVVPEEMPEPAAPSAGGTLHPLPSPAPRRILVVDDNEDAAEGLADFLRTLGHQVATAHNGPAALTEAGRFRPDLVFMDIAMPGMDGYEVARRLRREVGLDSSLLVALTGYGQPCDRELTREAGFDHHLVKPLDIARLEDLLRAAH